MIGLLLLTETETVSHQLTSIVVLPGGDLIRSIKHNDVTSHHLITGQACYHLRKRCHITLSSTCDLIILIKTREANLDIFHQPVMSVSSAFCKVDIPDLAEFSRSGPMSTVQSEIDISRPRLPPRGAARNYWSISLRAWKCQRGK